MIPANDRRALARQAGASALFRAYGVPRGSQPGVWETASPEIAVVRPQLASPGASTRLANGVARACGRLGSARAFLLQMLRETWAASAASGVLSLEQRARLRVAIAGAMEAARKVVDFAYRAAGTTAIFEGSAFERRFRDLHTLLAQGQAHLSNFESAGQALFGIEPAQRL